MTTSIVPARRQQPRSRRETLGLLGLGAAMLGMEIVPGPASGQRDDVLTEALVLRDPEIPVAGNATGDIIFRLSMPVLPQARTRTAAGRA